jgi:hypothetical protein
MLCTTVLYLCLVNKCDSRTLQFLPVIQSLLCSRIFSQQWQKEEPRSTTKLERARAGNTSRCSRCKAHVENSATRHQVNPGSAFFSTTYQGGHYSVGANDCLANGLTLDELYSCTGGGFHVPCMYKQRTSCRYHVRMRCLVTTHATRLEPGHV